jgi:hypothetical protein
MLMDATDVEMILRRGGDEVYQEAASVMCIYRYINE